MKRLGFLAVIALAGITLMLASCGGDKPVIEPEVTPEPVEPVVVDTPKTPEPPPPPPPKLKASQLKTVYFDFDKYALRPDAKTDLDRNYDLLKEFPNAMIKIEGHCDERGTVEYNVSLGEKRAKATQDYLTGLGIDPGRISIISYGKERPVDPASTEAAWAKNRRCEFKIVSQ